MASARATAARCSIPPESSSGWLLPKPDKAKVRISNFLPFFPVDILDFKPEGNIFNNGSPGVRRLVLEVRSHFSGWVP